jgi:hypothetical protein
LSVVRRPVSGIRRPVSVVWLTAAELLIHCRAGDTRHSVGEQGERLAHLIFEEHCNTNGEKHVAK